MFKKISVIVIFFSMLAWPALASVVPNDQFYNQQWYLPKIKANLAWEKINSSPNIIVAIIDSGVQIDHPDLKDNIWRNQNEIPNNSIDDDVNGFIDDYNGWDFVSNQPDPNPKFESNYNEAGISHGTMIAGVVAATGNNGIGVTGVTWHARIMPLRVLNDRGEGRLSDVIRAVDYAVNNGADIINFSFVGFSDSQALEDAIARAAQRGVVVVAAAGNEQSAGAGYNTDDVPIFPASSDGQNGENLVLGVAATDALDQKADFSSFGFKYVDISAPGVRFFNTTTYRPNFANNEFNQMYDGFWSGTSMATPLVSGAVALMEEVNPRLNREQIIEILLGSADNINQLNPEYIGQLGSGRLNVAGAVNQAYVKLFEQSGRLVIGPYTGKESLIKVTNRKGGELASFLAYTSGFKGGVNIATGDINDDGEQDIITAPGKGGGPHIKVFDAAGNLKLQFFAYDKNNRGGVNVTAGDVDGNGQDEIITSPMSNLSTQIKVFDNKGRLRSQFVAFSGTFSGGINVAAGDIDGDGRDEIIAVPGKGGGSQVKIFTNTGKLKGQFFAYDKKFKGGVKVVVANLDGRADRNREEIIVSPGSGAIPELKVFDDHANIKKRFLAYGRNFLGGVNIAAGDINNDGLDEIMTGAGPSGGPHARIFDGNGVLLESFYADSENFVGGLSVGVVQIKN